MKRDRPEDYASPRDFVRHILQQELTRRTDLPPLASIEEEDGIGPRQLRPIQFQRFRKKQGDDGGRRPAGGFRLTFTAPCVARCAWAIRATSASAYSCPRRPPYREWRGDENHRLARLARLLFDNLDLSLFYPQAPARVLENQARERVRITKDTNPPILLAPFHQPLERREVTLDNLTISIREP
jgi:hypothetical protein